MNNSQVTQESFVQGGNDFAANLEKYGAFVLDKPAVAIALGIMVSAILKRGKSDPEWATSFIGAAQEFSDLTSDDYDYFSQQMYDSFTVVRDDNEALLKEFVERWMAHTPDATEEAA